MDMKLNYIVFFVLSILIIVASTILLGPLEREDEKAPPESVKQGREETAPPPPLGEFGEEPREEGALGLGEKAPTPPSPTPGAEARLITVKTPLYTGVIDTSGGRIVSWKLADFKASTAEDAPPVNVLHDTPGAANTHLRLAGIDIPNPIPFDYDGPEEVEISKGERELTLHWSNGRGIGVEKTYVIDPESYVLEHRFEVKNDTQARLTELVRVEWYAQMLRNKKASEYKRDFIALVSDKVERVDKKPKEKENFRGTTTWFGFSDKYFIATFLPEVGGETVLSLDPLDSDSLVGASFSYPRDTIPPGGRSLKVSRIYLGPLDYEQLRSLGEGLDNAIKYGWVGFLAKPMLSLLKLFYDWLRNYGLAIIAITLVIRIIFLPLTIKSMESMKEMQRKMQALKPKIDELKEKYKDDKTKQNQELMKLYSSHGVNPLSSLGGCLPLLIQIPVFIALYEVLLYSIELRHSAFLWVDNLAEPEHLFDVPAVGIPFRILPLAMGVSWYASQKLTPTSAPTADNMQAKVMEFMPVIFTIVFWGLPSGLILYWTVSNILSIVQQLYVNQRMAKKGRT